MSFGIRLRHWYFVRKRHTWEDYPPEAFKHGYPCGVPVEPYLQQFIKKGNDLQCQPYGLSLSEGERYENIWRRYRDAAYGLVLTCGGKAIALVTWNCESDGSAILIKQVQGVKGAAEQLRPLRWEKALYQMAMDWAVANGFRVARVIRAEKHPYFSSFEKEPKVVMKYEATAKRMGFRPVPGKDYLEHSLEPAEASS